jgi:predicted RNase H-like HicB family nuclease
MSDKSKKYSKAVDRPFAPKVLAEAQKIAEQYQLILSHEDDAWYGRGLELPHVLGDGRTSAECISGTREALVGAVAYLLEQGQRPPTPAREGTRTEQVNVRLTAEEKVVLETTARRKGFKGLSDFIRAAALDAANR